MEFFKILEDLTSLLRGTEQDTWITMFGNVDQHDDKVSTLKAEIPKDIDHLIEKAFQSKLHQVKVELPKQIHVIEKAFQAKDWFENAMELRRINTNKLLQWHRNEFDGQMPNNKTIGGGMTMLSTHSSVKPG
ncbi:hypothetical protein RHGRI_030629 [Rhododendron griersonianum]|uniref:Uncharacterized protein n=1 Tax=Rhododendron griersonianum TaxID=479676 RepID=A0AAV6I4R4_9ERIC|nr:hypothetical protein RHGRI_030629 [Rhododendron griersonianum]